MLKEKHQKYILKGMLLGLRTYLICNTGQRPLIPFKETNKDVILKCYLTS